MGPGVRRSIRQGFQSANRSVPGIAFFGGCWLLLWFLTVLLIGRTGVPAELFQPPTAPEETAGETLPAEAPTGEPVAQQATTEGTAVPVDAATTASDPGEAARVEVEERVWLMLEWVGRAWPVLLVGFLGLIAAGLWLQGGQIGYLAKMVQTQQTSLSEMWVAGTRAFRALLGGWLLSFLAYGALGIVLAFLSFLVGAMPNVLGGIVVLLLMLTTIVGLVWLGVRLAFWFIGIVVDGVGPITGLKTTFRATRGRWWNVLGLVALLALIFFGVSLAVALLDGLGNFVGGPLAVVIGVLTAVLNLVANLYLGFVATAALIRFYTDTKSLSATAAPVGVEASS